MTAKFIGYDNFYTREARALDLLFIYDKTEQEQERDVLFYFILFYFPDFREQCKADSVCCVVANLAKIAGCAAMYVCMYVCMYGDL